jgi:hypothetical protein
MNYSIIYFENFEIIFSYQRIKESLFLCWTFICLCIHFFQVFDFTRFFHFEYLNFALEGEEAFRFVYHQFVIIKDFGFAQNLPGSFYLFLFF